MNIIQQHLSKIQNAMKKHGVRVTYAFGSAVKNAMHVNSDIDFLIRFPENLDAETYTGNYFSLIDELEKLLGKKVELTAEETLSNPYLIQSIDSHKCRYYDFGRKVTEQTLNADSPKKT